jgi:hypothetical protein
MRPQSNGVRLVLAFVSNVSFHLSSPHQTGVTERSIRSGVGHAAGVIVRNVVVGHLANRAGVRVAAATAAHKHGFLDSTNINLETVPC